MRRRQPVQRPAGGGAADARRASRHDIKVSGPDGRQREQPRVVQGPDREGRRPLPELPAPLPGLPGELPARREGGVRLADAGGGQRVDAAGGADARGGRRVPGVGEGAHPEVGGAPPEAHGRARRQGEAADGAGRAVAEQGGAAAPDAPGEALRPADGRADRARLGGATQGARPALEGAPAAEAGDEAEAQGRLALGAAAHRGQGVGFRPVPGSGRGEASCNRGRLVAEQ
mmetsp:Transcript_126277/g.357119  ORF Transcript_126277/g.357119 Transcript_126277/m.357119 type:complete len:230 (-) Transcript_126277:1414-2103(-)